MNLRLKKFKWAGFKQTMPRLYLWLVTVTYLCLYFSLAHPATANAGTLASQVVQQSSTVSTVTTTINSPKAAKPNEQECIFAEIFWLLVVVGIILGALWLLCRAAKLCGNSGNQPPESPSNGDTDVRFGPSLGHANALVINTNISLPSTIFYYTGGVLQSNTAGLPNSTLPPFIRINGQPLPFGGEIQQNAGPGITTPASIGVWNETNTFFDENLDPVYPYTYIYNFSVLTSTNIVSGTETNWGELCTIVGWVNSNPGVPLSCYVTYTNNVPAATNWAQCYLNEYLQPTNIVVYGNLLNLTVANPIGVTGITTNSSSGGGGPPPSPNPTNTVSSGPVPVINNPAQFFMLSANTNAISTSWTP